MALMCSTLQMEEPCDTGLLDDLSDSTIRAGSTLPSFDSNFPMLIVLCLARLLAGWAAK